MRFTRHLNGSAKAQETAQGRGGAFLLPSRRGLLTGLASLIAVPAVVSASSPMPIKAFHGVSVEVVDWQARYHVVLDHFHKLTWELMKAGRAEVIETESAALGRAFDNYPFGLNPPPSSSLTQVPRHG